MSEKKTHTVKNTSIVIIQNALTNKRLNVIENAVRLAKAITIQMMTRNLRKRRAVYLIIPVMVKSHRLTG